MLSSVRLPPADAYTCQDRPRSDAELPEVWRLPVHQQLAAFIIQLPYSTGCGISSTMTRLLAFSSSGATSPAVKKTAALP